MSANHSLSGPSALKSRFTRSGAAHGCGAACLAPPFGRLAQPRVVPAQPLSRMMRALGGMGLPGMGGFGGLKP